MKALAMQTLGLAAIWVLAHAWPLALGAVPLPQAQGTGGAAIAIEARVSFSVSAEVAEAIGAAWRVGRMPRILRQPGDSRAGGGGGRGSGEFIVRGPPGFAHKLGIQAPFLGSGQFCPKSRRDVQLVD